MLKVGDQAPDLAVATDEGTSKKLSDFRGEPLVVFFYPMDDTPG